jgi:hypothetical protein
MSFDVGGTQIYAIEEIASKLGVSPASLKRLARRGDLVARKVGSTWFVTAQNLLRFLDSPATQHVRKASAHHPIQTPPTPGESTPSEFPTGTEAPSAKVEAVPTAAEPFDIAPPPSPAMELPPPLVIEPPPSIPAPEPPVEPVAAVPVTGPQSAETPAAAATPESESVPAEPTAAPDPLPPLEMPPPVALHPHDGGLTLPDTLPPAPGGAGSLGEIRIQDRPTEPMMMSVSALEARPSAPPPSPAESALPTPLVDFSVASLASNDAVAPTETPAASVPAAAPVAEASATPPPPEPPPAPRPPAPTPVPELVCAPPASLGIDVPEPVTTIEGGPLDRRAAAAEATLRRQRALTPVPEPAAPGTTREHRTLLETDEMPTIAIADIPPGAALPPETREVVAVRAPEPPAPPPLSAVPTMFGPDAPTLVLRPELTEKKEELDEAALRDLVAQANVARTEREAVIKRIRKLPLDQQSREIAGPSGDALVKLDRIIENGQRAERLLGIASQETDGIRPVVLGSSPGGSVFVAPQVPFEKPPNFGLPPDTRVSWVVPPAPETPVKSATPTPGWIRVDKDGIPIVSPETPKL